MCTYSFVILTFNSARYVQRCLESVIDSCASLNAAYEIFVIDNGSKDKTLALINEIQKKRNATIHLTEFEENTGTTFSRNIGLRAAVGQWIVVLDSDAYVNADALQGLSQYLAQNSACGLVVPRLSYLDGRFQLSTDRFPTLARKAQRFLFLKQLEGEQTEQETTAQQVDYAISAFWMFPRAIIQQVGLLDENIFYSPEDVDFCLRIWKAGYYIQYLPAYEVIHDAQELSRGFRFNRFTWLHIKGLIYYFIKHRYFWGLSPLYKSIDRYGYAQEDALNKLSK